MAASVVHISTLKEGRGGDCSSVTLILVTILGSKNKSIYLRDFKDVDFSFTHFANFKYAYFNIEVSFWLVWLNLQWPISLANFDFGYLKGACFK